MSARSLSTRADLSPSYISKVEAGDIEPSFRAFAKIACALEMTEQEIMLLVWAEAGLLSHPVSKVES